MIRDAVRSIGRMPGLAAVVVLSLGVGIGVNTAVFAWIQAIVLKPIPGVDDSGSFYRVEPKADTGSYPGMSWTEYRDLTPQLQSIEELVAQGKQKQALDNFNIVVSSFPSTDSVGQALLEIGRYHMEVENDSGKARVSVLGTASIGDWHRRRFRGNVIVETGEVGEEQGLVGARLAVGTVELDVTKGIDRCVMTTRPQPDGIERDLSVLKTINAELGGNLGIGGLVTTPGRVAIGDEITRLA